MVQRLRLCASTYGGAGSIPGRGTKDPTCRVVRPKTKTNKQTKTPEIGMNFLNQILNFIYLFVYLFIYLFLAALGLCCCVWAFSSCSQRGLLFVGARASHCSGFSCCGARALGAPASVVVARRLSCSAACGIFPDQGSNPCPLHWQTDS